MESQLIAGRYQVVRPVGRGGMGTVWLCTDEVLGRQVAVKQVGTLPGETSIDLARALREARSSAALNHRNVVSVYDAVEEGDRIWLVMEYVPGRTLAETVAQDGPLPPLRAAWIGAQVADGLSAAHLRGTIHRDVKPGNILLTGDDTAKISDFGIARTSGDMELTRAGLLTGTPAYFSPEVARGEAPSPAADVWALGATLFTAVEGHPLYPEQPNPIALLTLIAAGRPPRPERAGLLAEPISRMLDPDPHSRWSMADAAYVLRRLHDRHGQEAASRTRAVTSAFAAPVVTKPAEADPVEVHPAEETSATEVVAREGAGSAQPPQRRGGRGGRVVLALVALLAVVAATGLYLLRGLDDDTSGGDAATPAAHHRRDRAKDTTTPSPEGSTDPTPTESTPSDSASTLTDTPTPTSPTGSSTPTSTPAAGSGAQQFVTNYYAALPGDTATGWASLSPEFQARVGSYESYRGFWATIRDVAVTSVRPAGAGAVDVALTYTTSNGGTDPEVRRIFLERSGDSYLIVRDQIVG